MRKLLLALCLLQIFSYAQVPVVLAPPPKLQFLDNSGRPLSFGCVFTYQSGTTTPLTTYTDHTGSIVNANPVPLNAGGFAGGGSSGIWLQAGQAYTLKVVAHGGTNCASGTTQYTIDGIGGSGSQQVTTQICSGSCPFTVQAEIQMFSITLTGSSVGSPVSAVGVLLPGIIVVEIIQDIGGGNTWTWPPNVVGGASVALGGNAVTTQAFVWDGTNAIALGPATEGNGPLEVADVFKATTGFQGGSFSGSSFTGTSMSLSGAALVQSLAANSFVTAGGPIAAGTWIDSIQGYKINNNWGSAGDCLTSTGSGTTFTPFLCTLGGTPTVTPGASAGTGATASVLANSLDRAGVLSVVIGTSLPLGGTFATVTFSSSFTTSAFCTFSPANDATSRDLLKFYITATTANFLITTNTSGALTFPAGTAYNFSYTCSGH